MTSCSEGFRTSSRGHPGGLGRRLLSPVPEAGQPPCGPLGAQAQSGQRRSPGRRWACALALGGVVCACFMQGATQPRVATGHIPGAVELQDSSARFVICVFCHR